MTPGRAPAAATVPTGVDIDRYMLEHQAAWDRLAALTATARRGPHKLAPHELDDLVTLYQRTSSHLSYVRTVYRDQALVVRLTALVADASTAIYGQRSRSLLVLRDFFAITFPVAVWRARREILLSALFLFGPAIGTALWLLNSPEAMEQSASAAEREVYVADQFEQYYSDRPAPQFATEVTVNNILVAMRAFAFGAAGCVVGVFTIAVNGLALGQASAWMIEAGDSLRFWGLILPHGLLEISAIIIAGGAGIRLGWRLIAPGDRSRLEVAAVEGSRSMAIVLGLIATFATAGLIEGFVTGSGQPAGLRVGIGVLVELAFVTYVVALGRRGDAAGYTGALGELDTGRAAPAPVAV
jgi:uncharacterized membrane protein SpoIIM required for sporulation